MIRPMMKLDIATCLPRRRRHFRHSSLARAVAHTLMPSLRYFGRSYDDIYFYQDVTDRHAWRFAGEPPTGPCHASRSFAASRVAAPYYNYTPNVSHHAMPSAGMPAAQRGYHMQCFLMQLPCSHDAAAAEYNKKTLQASLAIYRCRTAADWYLRAPSMI